MDRRSAARQTGLLVVAFGASFALLVGGWVILNRLGSAGPRPTAAPTIPAPSSEASPSVAGSAPSARSATPTPAPTVPPAVGPAASDAPTFVLQGAGDIARCSLDGARQTSDLLLRQPGWIFTAGDNAYDDGSKANYAKCYDPTWGRVLDRTILPAPGNHDWQTKDAKGYREYFGTRATPNGTTWYSTTIGTWHVIVLDSECDEVGGCGPSSAQGRWLADDLAASREICTLAIWHAPRFSSGFHGDAKAVAPFWEALYAANAELIVNGHDHDYERFAPQTPGGRFDAARGIRELVVGTGGGELREFTHGAPNAEFRLAQTLGIVRLTLHPTGYEWAFLAVDGSIKDSGSTGCHA